MRNPFVSIAGKIFVLVINIILLEFGKKVKRWEKVGMDSLKGIEYDTAQVGFNAVLKEW